MIEPCNSKLQLCKDIKIAAGIGLKESKDFCDEIFDGKVVTIDFLDSECQEFVKKIKNWSSCYDPYNNGHQKGKFLITGDDQWMRNVKILSIGLAEKHEYVDFIKEYYIDNDDIKEFILDYFLKKSKKNHLMDIITYINKLHSDDCNL